jgi:hypothetical protein
MKQSKIKTPYENYELPESSKQGGRFIDFNAVSTKKTVKKVKIKRKL